MIRCRTGPDNVVRAQAHAIGDIRSKATAHSSRHRDRLLTAAVMERLAGRTEAGDGAPDGVAVNRVYGQSLDNGNGTILDFA